MNRFQKLLLLFKTTFFISMSANSGYAILSVMKNTFVDKYGWFREEEMADYIALAQSVPGPIGINASMVVGYQSEGICGALAAVLGCALPPLLMMIAVTFFYSRIIDNRIVSLFLKGMQYGVAAMILDVIVSLFINVTKKDLIYPLCIILISFIYIRFTDCSLFYLALSCIAAGVIKAIMIKKVKENV